MEERVDELTAAIASGDTEAFARFYRRWFDFTFAQAARVLRTGTRDEHRCMDIVHDAMLRVIRSIKPMRTEGDVERWLRAVVQSCCYDHLRKELRRRRREQRSGASDASQGLHEVRDQLEWLHEQLSQVDRDTADVLSMRFRLGWTLQRIGRALGITPGAVDGRINRAVARLREKAEEQS